MRLRVKAGKEREFEGQLLQAMGVVQGIGYKKAAEMVVSLKVDKAMFHVTGNKRIRIKKMTKLFKRAMCASVFEHVERIA